jgi:hypothetical protein
MICNMTEALALYISHSLVPHADGEFSLYDAFEVKLRSDEDELKRNIKRVFGNHVCGWNGGVIVFDKGAKAIARYYLNERYLDGIVDVRFEPERKGNGYLIRLC